MHGRTPGGRPYLASQPPARTSTRRKEEKSPRGEEERKGKDRKAKRRGQERKTDRREITERNETGATHANPGRAQSHHTVTPSHLLMPLLASLNYMPMCILNWIQFEYMCTYVLTYVYACTNNRYIYTYMITSNIAHTIFASHTYTYTYIVTLYKHTSHMVV